MSAETLENMMAVVINIIRIVMVMMMLMLMMKSKLMNVMMMPMIMMIKLASAPFFVLNDVYIIMIYGHHLALIR